MPARQLIYAQNHFLMKNLSMLCAALAFTTMIFGQRRLEAIRSYSMFDGTEIIDSVAFTYGIPSLQYLDQVLPVFSEREFIFSWYFDLPDPNYTSGINYSFDYSTGTYNALSSIEKNYNLGLCGNRDHIYGPGYAYRQSFTYDLAGNILEIRDSYAEGSPDFTDLQYHEFEYNGANRKTIDRYYHLFIPENLISIDSLFYDSENLLEEKTSYFLNNSMNGYFQSNHCRYGYTPNGIDYIDWTYREDENEPFLPTEFIQYRYLNNLPDSLIVFNYENGVPSPIHNGGTTYSYDGSGRPLAVRYFDEEGVVKKEHHYTYMPDEDFVLTEEIYSYSSFSSQMELSARRDFFYSGSTNELKENTMQFSLSPNPAENVLEIRSAEVIRSAKIISISGISFPTVFSGQSVDITSLPSGMYILEATSDQGATAVQRFVKR